MVAQGVCTAQLKMGHPDDDDALRFTECMQQESQTVIHNQNTSLEVKCKVVEASRHQRSVHAQCVSFCASQHLSESDPLLFFPVPIARRLYADLLSVNRHQLPAAFHTLSAHHSLSLCQQHERCAAKQMLTSHDHDTGCHWELTWTHNITHRQHN